MNAWPEIARRLAAYDPGNQYAVNYMWGTTGIGYNVKAVHERLGPDATIDSWDVVFKPELIAKFKDCGVHMLDSADDIMPAALHYLGLDPNSTKPADLEKADRAADARSGPSVRKFHSSEYLNALASGEICLVVGWSGDVKQAQKRAAEAKNGVEIGYAIPKEGAQMWFDNLAIPKDAPHTSPRPTPSSTICCARKWRRRTSTWSPTPTAISPARNSSTRRCSTTRASIRTPRPWASSTRSARATSAAQRLINRLWTKVKTGE